METTDQNVHGESSEDMGPLLMHDPDDEDDDHSLSSADQHTLLSDVHLPGGSAFITADVEKGHQLDSIDHSINIEKEDVIEKPTSGEEAIEEGSQEQAVPFKFTDGQPVTMEDGSTAYVLSTYKEGTQPIIFEDGATMYISHEPPSKFDDGIDNPSLGMLHEFSPPPISDSEEKRLAAAAQLAGHDQKLFKCEFEGCQKVYTTYHHLQYHRRSHLERKPFVCGYSGCDKTFSTSYGLKSHIRVHTGEKPYKCPHTDVCNKAFKTSGDLQKHIRIHTGEKPFRCPFQGCQRSFTTSNIRKVHIRTHTGEKPYNCEECGKRFSSATNHRNHMRIHTGERPYACQHQGCTKRFTEYSSLYKHQVVHSSEKPYTCSQCGKLYRQASTLAMHKRTAHGEPDVVLTESDMMAGQLIALEHGKGTVISTEVVGLLSSHHKQYASSRIMTTSTNQLMSGRQQMHFTHIDPNNVVVVTDPSCYKVVESQGASTSSEPTEMIYASCLQEEAMQSAHALTTAGSQKISSTSCSTGIITESIDLSTTATATDLSTEHMS